VPNWGLPLPRPLPVIGLAGLYPANSLMGRSPILGRPPTGSAEEPLGKESFQSPLPIPD
jgi:hypothetical protein